jgi:hypothetical protein
MVQGQRSACFTISGPILRIIGEKFAKKNYGMRIAGLTVNRLIVLNISVTMCENQWTGCVSSLKNGR